MTVSETAIAIHRLAGEIRSLRIEMEQLHEQVGDLRDDLRAALARKEKKP